MNTFTNDLIVELNDIMSPKGSFDNGSISNSNSDTAQTQILTCSPSVSRTDTRECQFAQDFEIVKKHLWFKDELKVFYFKVPKKKEYNSIKQDKF